MPLVSAVLQLSKYLLLVLLAVDDDDDSSTNIIICLINIFALGTINILALLLS